MIMSRKFLALAAAGVSLASAAETSPVEKIAAGVSVVRGPVNGLLIQRSGETLAIYGDPRPEPVMARHVLFTHHRRDVVWAGRRLVEQGAKAVAPEAEKALFADVGPFWERYRTARFHDYANQSSRIVAEPVPLSRTVRDGDTIVIDPRARTLNLEVSHEELARRMADWRAPDPAKRVRPGSVHDKYIRLVSSAHYGCVV